MSLLLPSLLQNITRGAAGGGSARAVLDDTSPPLPLSPSPALLMTPVHWPPGSLTGSGRGEEGELSEGGEGGSGSQVCSPITNASERAGSRFVLESSRSCPAFFSFVLCIVSVMEVGSFCRLVQF